MNNEAQTQEDKEDKASECEHPDERLHASLHVQQNVRAPTYDGYITSVGPCVSGAQRSTRSARMSRYSRLGQNSLTGTSLFTPLKLKQLTRVKTYEWDLCPWC